MYLLRNSVAELWFKTTIIEDGVTEIKKPHSYEVTTVELSEESAGQKWSERHGTASVLSRNSDTSSEGSRAVPEETIRAAKLLKGVEKSYDKGVKLLDVSEKSRQAGGVEAASDVELTEDGETPSETNGDKTKFRDGATEGERLLAIRGLEPIEVEGNNLSKAELQEVYRNLPSVEKDGRKVEFYHSAFKKIYKDGGLFGQIVPVLDEVLEQSVLAYSEGDNLGGMVRPDGTVHKAHPNTISFDNYVGKVNIGGEEYFVRTTIQNDKGNRSGMHSCLVTNVEVYKNTAGETTSTEIPRVKSASDGIVDAKLQQFFERASAELLPYDMRQRAIEISEKLNTPIKLVDSADEVMENPSARHRNAKGWMESDGKIEIVVPNNVNVADIENTAVHEIVGHSGLRAFIGADRFDDFLGEVYDHAGAKIKKEIDKRTEAMVENEADRLTRQKGGGVFAEAEARVEAGQKREQFRKEATEEYMADMAGEIGDKGFEKMDAEIREESLGLWRWLKGKVQRLLDRFLTDLHLPKSFVITDKGLQYILYKSWKHMRNGGKADVFDKAEDAVMRRKTGYGEPPLVEVAERERQQFREDKVADNIEMLFDEAVTGNLTGKPVEVGKLTADGKAYLEKLSGMMLKDDVSFVLNPSDLVHIHNRHFGNNEHDGRNIPLTKDDIRAIASIVSNPSRIVYAKEKTGSQRNLFFFLKENETGSYNLLEVYADRKGNLTSKSFFKSKEGVSQRVISLKNDPTLYVRDGWGNPLDGANLPKFFEYPKSDDEPQYHFRDSGLGLEETITKMKMEAMQANTDNLQAKRDAMRAIGGNLHHLRQAMARQKEYDLTTVKSNAKGWMESDGKIVIVVPNNVNVADIENTVVHEIVGHNGLRAFIGEENLPKFLDEVYNHLGKRLKAKADAIFEKQKAAKVDRVSRLITEVGVAEAARREGVELPDDVAEQPLALGIDRAYAHVWMRGKEEQMRRDATEEYMADMAGEIGDKGFEKMDAEIREESLGLWRWLKEKVQRLLDRFLTSLHLPKSFVITDKGLQYILYKSWKHKRNGGKPDVFDRAEDIVMRRKTGWDKKEPTWKETCIALTETGTKKPNGKTIAVSDSRSRAETPRYVPSHSDAAKIQKISERLKSLSQNLPDSGLGKNEILADGVDKKNTARSEARLNAITYPASNGGRNARGNEARLNDLDPASNHDAKVIEKLEIAKAGLYQVAETYRDTNNPKRFLTDLSRSMDLIVGQGGSGYRSFELQDGRTMTHNANSERAKEGMVSIVIKYLSKIN